MKKLITILMLLTAGISFSQTVEETFELGRKCFYSDDFDGANKYFMEILNLQDDGYLTHFYKGRIYEIYFDYDKALDELNTVISRKKKFGEAYLVRAVILEKRGDTAAAISDYTEAIKNGEKTADAYFNRGSLYQGIGEADKAIKDFSSALKLNPSDDIIYYNRGKLYMSVDEKEKAIKDFERAIEIDKAWEKELRELINMLSK